MQARSGGRVGSNLVELGAVDERTLAHVLAQQLNIPSASAAQLDQPGQAAIERVTRALAERHRAVPLRIDGQRLWVALADPTDREALRALERESGMEVRAMVAPDVLIDFALGKHYGVRRRTRVLEVRDAQLLEVDAIEELPTYEPHVEHEADDDTIAAPMKLGFLDERPAPAKAPPGPRLSSLEGVRARLMAASTDRGGGRFLLEALRDAAARFAISPPARRGARRAPRPGARHAQPRAHPPAAGRCPRARAAARRQRALLRPLAGRARLVLPGSRRAERAGPAAQHGAKIDRRDRRWAGPSGARGAQ